MYVSPPDNDSGYCCDFSHRRGMVRTVADPGAQVILVLSTATHQKLAIMGKKNAAVDGHALTVVQIIEELTNNWEKDNGAPTE